MTGHLVSRRGWVEGGELPDLQLSVFPLLVLQGKQKVIR